ncbi:Extracellular metalloprotease [Ceratobasidium theobromae]|uniref:Extracellular metalloprotease n=1 Tax=Ceratobasidium theobromae TaxID=1582974 RepID=A0A5N5QC68_9AGAM|nr:Extracellular metalloprotease [Ceratobasidium theobromae]
MVLFNRLFAAAAAFGSAFAMPASDARAEGAFACGAHTPTIAGLPASNETLIAQSASVAAAGDRLVNVYWWAINAGSSYNQGYLSDAQVNSAVTTLNQYYSGQGFQFRLVGGQRVQNSNWFYYSDLGPDGATDNQYAAQMKNSLRTRNPYELNIYSVGLASSRLLGYATFPWWYSGAQRTDGVVFKWSTTPGGSEPGYGTGKILVHEVGHWLGLLHTFQGGCSDTEGDYVNECVSNILNAHAKIGSNDGYCTSTPAEASPASGCPTGRDTCPGSGVDPITNHMDYSSDNCRTGFTRGQVARMQAACAQYRGIS